MAVPFILAAAGAFGLKKGIDGAKKVKNAQEVLKEAEVKNTKNQEKLKTEIESTCKITDHLGEYELQILSNFKDFSDTVEKIQNRPQFEDVIIQGVEIPKYNHEDIKNVSIGAEALLDGLKSATIGTAGGFAASGAVMAAATSTTAAFASLGGAALTNAALASLGGGALIAGGGGIALGSAILGMTTLGVGLLVGGIVFDARSNKFVGQAEETVKKVNDTEKSINSIYEYLVELKTYSSKYQAALEDVRIKYMQTYYSFRHTVRYLNKTNWDEFTDLEKLVTKNCILLVGLLYKMCQVKLVKDVQSEEKEVDKEKIDKSIEDARIVIRNMIEK